MASTAPDRLVVATDAGLLALKHSNDTATSSGRIDVVIDDAFHGASLHGPVEAWAAEDR